MRAADASPVNRFGGLGKKGKREIWCIYPAAAVSVVFSEKSADLRVTSHVFAVFLNRTSMRIEICKWILTLGRIFVCRANSAEYKFAVTECIGLDRLDQIMFALATVAFDGKHNAIDCCGSV